MKSEEFIDYTELFSAIDSEITGIICIFLRMKIAIYYG